MSRQLPAQPSLEQLKKQAKDLLHAHRSGDPEAFALLRQHLPRLGNASDAEIRPAEVSLQEVQHVLAREYGFRDWNWLQAVARVDFDLLARLTDREIQPLLREVEQKDLVTALARTSDAAKTKLLGNMSERVRTFITEEAHFLGRVEAGAVREAQRPLLELADEPFRRGLQLVCDQIEPTKAKQVLEAALDEELRQARSRYRMAIAGNEAVQLGKEPELVARLVREAAASA